MAILKKLVVDNNFLNVCKLHILRPKKDCPRICAVPLFALLFQDIWSFAFKSSSQNVPSKRLSLDMKRHNTKIFLDFLSLFKNKLMSIFKYRFIFKVIY